MKCALIAMGDLPGNTPLRGRSSNTVQHRIVEFKSWILQRGGTINAGGGINLNMAAEACIEKEAAEEGANCDEGAGGATEVDDVDLDGAEAHARVEAVGIDTDEEGVVLVEEGVDDGPPPPPNMPDPAAVARDADAEEQRLEERHVDMQARYVDELEEAGMENFAEAPDTMLMMRGVATGMTLRTFADHMLKM